MPAHRRTALPVGILIALSGLGALAFWLSFSRQGTALCATIVERLIGDKPQARIAAAPDESAIHTPTGPFALKCAQSGIQSIAGQVSAGYHGQ